MYLKNLLICLLFSLTLAEVPNGDREPNGLVGGRDPKPGEVKYIVAVHSYIYMCGGGIISKKHVLTAAHCVNIDNHGKLRKPMRIVAGTNVATGYNKAHVIEIDVARAFLPSVYYNGNPDDIAVLELKKELNFVRYHNKIEKLNLPQSLPNDPSSYPSYEYQLVKFAGYGNTRAEMVQQNGRTEIKRSGAGPLKVANAVIVDKARCKKYFKQSGPKGLCLDVIEDKVRKNPQGTCTGDSGSPAVYNQTVIGLDSMGIYCNNNLAPTLFTRVSFFVPFIQRAMDNDTHGMVVYEA